MIEGVLTIDTIEDLLKDQPRRSFTEEKKRNGQVRRPLCGWNKAEKSARETHAHTDVRHTHKMAPKEKCERLMWKKSITKVIIDQRGADFESS